MGIAREVSVVLPTWNREALLARALRSVFSQTAPPGEVLVLDDGSTDGTERLVRDEFPGAKYARQENRGVSAARNRGIALANGAWIAFLDSDDEWLPRKLERQLAALRSAPGHLVAHTDEVWIRRGVRVNPRRRHAKHGGWIFRRCLPLCAISPSSALIHRSVFDTTGLFDEGLPACEDYDLWLRIAARFSVLYVDERLIVKHGGHQDQLSRRHEAMDRFRIRALEKVVRSCELGAEDRRAAIGELVRKAEVYIAGARKRGRGEEAREYERNVRAAREAFAAER